MPNENIKKFLESSAGKELKNVLIEKVQELENIQNIKELNNAEDLALEVKARQRAAGKLRDILSQFINFEKTGRRKEKDKYYII